LGIFQGHAWGIDKGLIPANGERREMDEPESPEVVKEHAIMWWNEMIVGMTTSCVLIISHGAWIRLLVQGLLGDKAIHAALGVQVRRCLNTRVSIVKIPRE